MSSLREELSFAWGGDVRDALGKYITNSNVHEIIDALLENYSEEDIIKMIKERNKNDR